MGSRGTYGERQKPNAGKKDARGLFFYRAVRILQIITEDDHQEATEGEGQRRWSRIVAKVYNSIKPIDANSVTADIVRNAYKKFRQWEGG